MTPLPAPSAPDLTTLVTLVVLIGLAALCAATDAAIGTAARARLKALAERPGARAATWALAMADTPERTAAALRLGQIFALGVALAMILADWPEQMGWAFGVMAACAFLGDLLPRYLASAAAEGVALRLAPVMRGPVLVLGTLPWLVARLLRAAGVETDPEARMQAMRDEILGAIALGHSEGAVEKEDRDRLIGALDLAERTVEEVMKHRRHIEMIDADHPADAILSQVLGSPHTRLPVYRDDVENIIGVIHAKDLLREVERLLRGGEGQLSDLDLMKVAMKPYFVPETTALDEQMREFLKRRTHFALVVDEYGALQGLITLEDILEEIVGEITDEFDVVRKDTTLRPDANGDYIIDGAMTIRDLNRAMEWQLPDDEANTIAGLVIHEAQMIPNEGQVFSFHGFRFEVAARRENRLSQLKIRPL